MSKRKPLAKAPVYVKSQPDPKKKLRLPGKAKADANAQQLFDRIAEEVLHQDRDLFDTLSEHERQLVIRWLSDAIIDGDEHREIHDLLWELDYTQKPVPIQQFVEDEYYLGRSAADLHPKWKEDLFQVFAPGSPIFEWLMTGCIGSGKCVAEGTRVPTTRGLLPIEQVCVGDSVQAESGVRPVTSVHDEGWTQTIEVTTKHGHRLEGRPNHRVRVLDGLALGWRRLRDLKPGDCVIQVPAVVFGKTSVSSSLAELAGWYLAEGGGHSTCYRLDLHPDELEYVRDLALEAVPQARVSVNERHRYVRISGVWLEDYFALGTSHQKRVPAVFFSAAKDAVCAFLRGYFSGDGTIQVAPSATTMSLGLAEDLRVLLTSLGISCSVHHSVAAYRRDGRRVVTGRRWVVSIIGRESKRRFAEEIGFVHEDKQETLLDSCTRASANEDHSFAFVLDRVAATALWAMQPRFAGAGRFKRTLPDGVSKYTSPTHKVQRLRNGQGCTVRLLREIREHGILPPVLDAIATGRLLFDTVAGTRATSAHCYDLTVDGDPSYVSGSFVSHNTTLACVSIARKLYELSCLRNAPAYYGLLTDSLIVFGVYSITKRQVADAGYFKLRGFIDSSPYFRNEFPRSTKIDSKIDFQRSTGRPIQVIPGSQELHALGLDLFSFLMDEVNFMRVKNNKEAGVQMGQAYSLYNATYTRLQSRFIRPGGTLPGLMLLLSSRGAQTSFLEEHMRKVRGQTSSFVSDYALWDVKPAHRFRKKWFRVEVGDRFSASRLLKEDETVRKGARIVEVPGEFHKPFTEDIDQALRDIAGVATFNLSPLIRDRQSVFDAIHPDMRHPFSRVSITISTDDDTRLDEFFLLQGMCRSVQSKWTPVLNPRSPRFIHCDIGLTADCLGIAMGHVAGMTKNIRYNPDGTESIVSNPFAVVELMLRVSASPGGEVDLSKIRSFLVYLSRLYPLTRVTFDGFQSADCIQILSKHGIESGLLSVDRTDEAYLSLRSALFDRRMACYEYAPFQEEVLDLERDAMKRKVDHPLKATRGGKGSKDVSDAVAGVIWHLTNDPRATSVTSLPEFEIDDVRGSARAQRVLHVAPAEVVVSEQRRVAGQGPAWDELRRNLQG